MDTLTQLPNANSLYLKALASLTRKTHGKPTIPALAVQVQQVHVETGHLLEYVKVCGYKNMHQLPITFPHVVAGALHLHLMTQASFPFPLLGLVHVRNVIMQTRPLLADEIFDVQVRLGEGRDVRQGIEFDLLTEVQIEGEPVWKEVSTILHRIPGPKGTRQPSVTPAAPLAQYRVLQAPSNIGMRYAAVGRDYNPIHLSPWTAKLFGFPRHIAHGMWSVARCASLLEAELSHAPQRLSVQFKQPLLLPGSANLKFSPGPDGIDFELLAARGNKTHLVGQLV